MSATLEAKKNAQATFITIGFTGLMILLMFILKWKLPVIEKIIEAPAFEVELNLPEEPPTPVSGGGGGGGNDVDAPKPAGVAPPSPPPPGINDESKDLVTDETDKASPEVSKTLDPKPVEKVVEKTSPVKTNPKPVENPAPPKREAKAQMGRTTTGAGNGGGTATTYDRSGGAGNGTGVGNGNGYGGGTGGGSGGGNGTGSGTGNGPKRISGNRTVINPKNMDAGENLRGKVVAEIRVSPDGIGTFVRTERGTTLVNNQAIEIVREWLRRNRFNRSNEESVVVYEFIFKMGS